MGPFHKLAVLIAFPASEHSDLKIRLEGGKSIYTTRVDAELDKYHQGQQVDTDLGEPLEVASVKRLHGLREHPFSKELTADQRDVLRRYREMDLVQLRKTAAPTCKQISCKELATDYVVWADGRAICATCPKHLAGFKKSLGEVVGVRTVAEQERKEAMKKHAGPVEKIMSKVRARMPTVQVARKRAPTGSESIYGMLPETSPKVIRKMTDAQRSALVKRQPWSHGRAKQVTKEEMKGLRPGNEAEFSQLERDFGTGGGLKKCGIALLRKPKLRVVPKPKPKIAPEDIRGMHEYLAKNPGATPAMQRAWLKKLRKPQYGAGAGLRKCGEQLLKEAGLKQKLFFGGALPMLVYGAYQNKSAKKSSAKPLKRDEKQATIEKHSHVVGDMLAKRAAIQMTRR